MSNEELLKPRYKLIADYPRNGHYENVEVGEVIDAWKPNKVIQKNFTDFYDKYPHLFQKLEWWEERKIEDMPEYNKVIVSHMEHYGVKEGQIIKVSWCYGADGGFVPFWTAMNKVFFNPYIVPSTEEEYLSSLAQLETANR